METVATTNVCSGEELSCQPSAGTIPDEDETTGNMLCVSYYTIRCEDMNNNSRSGH